MSPPGERVTLKVWRDHAERTIEARLGSADKDGKQVADAGAADQGALGLTLRPLTSDEKRQAKVDGGLVVEDVGGAAERGPKREELWVTPDTRAATLAPYLDGWRRKVERVGTINYPTIARRWRPGQVRSSKSASLEWQAGSSASIRRQAAIPNWTMPRSRF